MTVLTYLNLNIWKHTSIKIVSICSYLPDSASQGLNLNWKYIAIASMVSKGLVSANMQQLCCFKNSSMWHNVEYFPSKNILISNFAKPHWFLILLVTTRSFRNVTRWHHQMETSSALLALCVGNSPVTGEFSAQRPVTRSFVVFFDLRLNKRLSKQS